MSIFGRKKRRDGDEPDDATASEVAADGAPPAPAEAATRVPTTGPYDVADAPEDDLPRIDLGALRVPVPEGIEVRVEVSPEGQVVAATAVDRNSQLQINVFAAPRSAGIWAEVREEIVGTLRTQGGHAEEQEGPFGTELRGRVPSGQPGMAAPARFLGVDGPRWFLRGLLTGPAATDAAQAERLLGVFRSTVVARGSDAMAPRDALPLRLPREAAEAAEAADAAEGHDGARPNRDDLNPFERGPEITEVR